jgi:uncharacterized membrane protein YuzA (DUF378 family)
LFKLITKGGEMQTLQKICLLLTIIGAINWGLIGIFDFNLVATIFGDGTTLSRIIYSLVGIAGLINIYLLFYDFKD